ncbi:hypothetical protein UPYG_G00303560 [Umbra pygmaea]|uniref:C-type lectin domain-containing protein n=1 Tax=Umbra pygmaea TaxID=75934 RepID=A0ABD0W6T1_UMBPY
MTGQWQWLDETVLDFTNWGPEEPQNSSRSIYAKLQTSDGTWSSGNTWSHRSYICKKLKVLPKTPPTQAVPRVPKRVHYGLAVVVVVVALCLIGLTAGILYKKTGRPLPSISKPLVFRAGWKAFNNPLYNGPVNTDDSEVDTNTADSNQLVTQMD